MTTDALPAAIDADHLSGVLRASGALGADGAVRTLTVESSRATVLSRIVRLRLAYDGAAGAAPASLILKTGLPERGEAWRARANQREVAFYTQVAAAMPARLVPRCFEARFDRETNAWHLLLEDLTDTHMIASSWPLPPTLAQTERIVALHARFHAAWWDDPRLGVSIGTWLETGDAPLQAFAAKVEAFAERLGDRLAPERRDLYVRLIDQGHRLNARHHAHRNLTIVQGDAHVWNVFLPRAEDSDDARLFDWDSWRVDVATDDLAYMMALHWYPEHRHRAERLMLDRYHAGLLAHGVTGYDRRALDDDYRLSVLWQAATPVWQAAGDIPPWIWWPHLERIFQAIDDLGCRDLLAG